MNAEGDLIEVAGTVGDANAQSIQSEMRLSQDSLRVLADSTGGFAAVNRNDLNGAFDRIVSENSSYYMLGLLLDQRSPQRPIQKAGSTRQAARSARAQPQRVLRSARTRAVPAQRLGVADRDRSRALGSAREPAAGVRRTDESLCRTLQGHGAQRRDRARVRDRRTTISISSRVVERSTSRSRWPSRP